eukprot:g46505.t1
MVFKHPSSESGIDSTGAAQMVLTSEMEDGNKEDGEQGGRDDVALLDRCLHGERLRLQSTVAKRCRRHVIMQQSQHPDELIRAATSRQYLPKSLVVSYVKGLSQANEGHPLPTAGFPRPYQSTICFELPDPLLDISLSFGIGLSFGLAVDVILPVTEGYAFLGDELDLLVLLHLLVQEADKDKMDERVKLEILVKRVKLDQQVHVEKWVRMEELALALLDLKAE